MLALLKSKSVLNKILLLQVSRNVAQMLHNDHTRERKSPPTMCPHCSALVHKMCNYSNLSLLLGNIEIPMNIVSLNYASLGDD